MTQEIKRLFFGLEVQAPWPSHLPRGRLLDESHRHLTLAFLGNIPYQPLLKLLDTFPKPPISVGSVGYFDSCLTLPPRHPHVVAWHVHWSDDNTPIIAFQKSLMEWLFLNEYPTDSREWKPHVTLCRQPFNPRDWEKAFRPLPLFTGSIHLLESIGNLKYIPIWTASIPHPFEEIEHTADLAFKIRGENLQQIYLHAFTALAFKAPEFLDFFISIPSIHSLDEIIFALNDMIAKMDGAIGCPMKAVSFHGEIITLPDSLLQWEMIVDV